MKKLLNAISLIGFVISIFVAAGIMVFLLEKSFSAVKVPKDYLTNILLVIIIVQLSRVYNSIVFNSSQLMQLRVDKNKESTDSDRKHRDLKDSMRSLYNAVEREDISRKKQEEQNTSKIISLLREIIYKIDYRDKKTS